MTQVVLVSDNAALNDSSDATLGVRTTAGNYETFLFQFNDIALPSDASIQQIDMSARAATPGQSGFRLSLRTGNGGTIRSDLPVIEKPPVPNYALPTPNIMFPYGTTARPNGFTQADLNGLALFGEVLQAPDGSTDFSLAQVVVTITYNQPPVAASVYINPEVLTLTTTATPAVQAVFTDPDGDQVTIAEFKAFSSQQYLAAGFDPSVTVPVWASGSVYNPGGTTSIFVFDSVVRSGLVNLNTYKIFARGGDSKGTGKWGAWKAGNAFALLLEPVATPMVTAVDEDGSGRRAKITIQGRDNLLSTDQASAENAQAWLAETNTTINRYAAGGSPLPTNIPNGSQVTGITATAAGNISASTRNLIQGRVYAGNRYTAFAQFQSATVARQARVTINWTQITGQPSVIKPTSNSLVVNTTVRGRWITAAVTDTAPADAVTYYLTITVLNCAASERHYFDASGLVPGFVNLMSLTASTVEGGSALAEWSTSFGGCNLAIDSVNRRQGEQSLLISTTTSAPFFRSNNSTPIPVIPGAIHTVMASLRGPSTQDLAGSGPVPLPNRDLRQIRIDVIWLDVNTNVLSTQTGAATGTEKDNNEFTVISSQVTAPVSAYFCIVQVNILSTNSNAEVHQADTFGMLFGTTNDWVAGPPFTRGGLVPVQHFDIQRSIDGGITWQSFRDRVISNGVFIDLSDASINASGLGNNDGSSNVYGQSVTLYDYEAPLGGLIKYRAKSLAPLDASYSGQSQWSLPATVKLGRSFCSWVKDPLDPSRNSIVTHNQKGMVLSTTTPKGIFYASNRSDPIVISGKKRLPTFPVTLWFHDDEAYQWWLVMEESNRKLLFQTGFGDQIGVEFYFTIDSDVTTELLTARGMQVHQMRRVNFVARATSAPAL